MFDMYEPSTLDCSLPDLDAIQLLLGTWSNILWDIRGHAISSIHSRAEYVRGYAGDLPGVTGGQSAPVR